MPTHLTNNREHVSVSSMPGPWATIGKREISTESKKFRTEAGAPKTTVKGPTEFGDIALTRHWDSDREPGLWLALSKNPGQFDGTSITTQELDAENIPIPGTSVTYTGCAVSKAEKDDADADGDDPIKLTVTFTIGGVA